MKTAIKTYRNLFIIALIALFTACGGNNTKKETKSTTPDKLESRPAGNLKIAFYVQDTLKTQYTYYVEQDSLIAKKQMSLQNQLVAKDKELQSSYANYQSRMQAGQLSQMDDQKYQQKLQKMQMDMEQFQQNEGQKLQVETATKLDEIGNKIDAAAKLYCEKHGIDMLLVYGKGGQFSYINSAFDVTEEFTNFLNDEEARIKAELK